MLQTLLLTVPLLAFVTPSALAQDPAEIQARAEKLVAAGDEDGARAAWEELLRLEPENEAARQGLGHRRYGDTWYETYAELSAARRAEARKMKKEGLLRLGEEWVPEAEFPFRRMGWVQGAGGRWMHPADKARAEKETKLAADGWQQQGHVWIPPAEFDSWRAGLWKVGEDWVDATEANQRRSQIAEMWMVKSDKEGGKFVAGTTVDADSARWVWWWADQTWSDLVRIFGVEPQTPLEIICLNDIPQYNAFAAGDPAQGLSPTEASGHSSLHYAYFAEAWFDGATQPPRFEGKGVCWWNPTDESLKAYGQHAVRHAAAQSFIEAIDPSWMAVSEAIVDPSQGFSTNMFWAEKRIPRWLRYGAASYVERFFKDGNAQDAWWARKWAMANLVSAGGLPELEELFAFQLSNTDAELSGRLMQGAGAVVAYMLDGGDSKVMKAHAGLRKALKSGGDVNAACGALEEALLGAAKNIGEFAQG